MFAVPLLSVMITLFPIVIYAPGTATFLVLVTVNEHKYFCDAITDWEPLYMSLSPAG